VTFPCVRLRKISNIAETLISLSRCLQLRILHTVFLKWFVRKENIAVGSLPCEQCSVAECCLYSSMLGYEVCLPDTNTPSLHSLCSPCVCVCVCVVEFCQQLNFANVKKRSRYIDCVSLEGTTVGPWAVEVV
jgi:hypothetical protein